MLDFLERIFGILAAIPLWCWVGVGAVLLWRVTTKFTRLLRILQRTPTQQIDALQAALSKKLTTAERWLTPHR